ncbi:MAG: hypothetical protein ACR2NU_14750 [Aeoliella sp.]
MSSNARDGRRRRMLQEEVKSASSQLAAYDPDAAATANGEGRRYAVAEGSLGGALARRHFPSHLLVPIGFAFAGLAAVAGSVMLHLHRESINLAGGGNLMPLVDLTSAGSFGRWLASAAMLLSVVLAAMVFAVRRRRVDDYRGRYRLWRGAMAIGLLLSIDAVTNLHTMVASALSHVTGFTLLSGGAEWWIAGGALVGGWVGVRVFLDVKESRLALVAYLAAAASYVACFASHFGWLPVAADVAVTVTHAALIAGHLLVATALVSYTRFLRRDVEAGVATRPQKARPAESKPAKTQAKKQDRPTPARTSHKSTKRSKAEKPTLAANTQWTDGSDGEETYGDDTRPRKLSKSERKRLRKQKAQRRAA